jgi:hypothetical protein
MSFDVVIPLGPNDDNIIKACITSVRKYVYDLRRIYVVAYRPIDLSGAIVIDENIFPFSKTDVQPFVKSGTVGWYLQQLIKMYAPSVIPDVHANIVLIDADTVFYKRVTFMNRSKFLFNTAYHTHRPYFQHMLRLHSSFIAWKRGVSGVVNLMIINRSIMKEIIDMVEGHHKEAFWKVFMTNLDPAESSGGSEYEIYFHYIMRNHPGRVEIRALQYDNAGNRNKMDGGFYHYVNYHAWAQK